MDEPVILAFPAYLPPILPFPVPEEPPPPPPRPEWHPADVYGLYV